MWLDDPASVRNLAAAQYDIIPVRKSRRGSGHALADTTV
jgi:hypothetical protein